MSRHSGPRALLRISYLKGENPSAGESEKTEGALHPLHEETGWVFSTTAFSPHGVLPNCQNMFSTLVNRHLSRRFNFAILYERYRQTINGSIQQESAHGAQH